MRCNFGQFGLLKSPLQMYDFVYDSAIVIQTAGSSDYKCVDRSL
jgi:hypothetical protein